MFGNEISKALDRLTDKVHQAIIEGFERGAKIIAEKMGELNEAKGKGDCGRACGRSEGRRNGKGVGSGR